MGLHIQSKIFLDNYSLIKKDDKEKKIHLKQKKTKRELIISFDIYKPDYYEKVISRPFDFALFLETDNELCQVYEIFEKT